MAGKRTHGDDGASGDGKRSRSNNGSPAPQPASSSNTSNASASASIQAQIAAAKAKAAAAREKLRGMNRAGSGASSPAPPPPPPASAAPNGEKTLTPLEQARARIEAAKARVAAITPDNAGGAAAAPRRPPAIPTQANRMSPAAVAAADGEESGARTQRGGLGVGLHPMLMGAPTVPEKGRAIGTKFGTTLGNRRQQSPATTGTAAKTNQYTGAAPSLDEVKANPYFDASLGNSTAAPKERSRRELVFHQKGTFIAQAAALRRQAQLEEMKRRIAESARKAGLEEDRSEQAFVVQAPPEVEWWDEGLVTSTQIENEQGQVEQSLSYPNFDDGDDMAAEAHMKIHGDDTIVTRYVQHPALIAAPQEQLLVPVKPMYLTKEEQKKKRRQMRAEMLHEKQAKVRLGLEAPEPAKIKKSNLMRVLGEQAVKDPTAVEARVNREIADRRDKHETGNEERKLTVEQRLEKTAANREADRQKGLVMCVFRIDSLAYGKHRFKVDFEAKKYQLTGMTILNPRLNLVVVEGGQWAMNKYKKLLLQRIDWTQNGFSTQQSSAAPNHRQDEAAAEQTWLKPEDDDGRLRDMSANRCVLVWEGEEKQPAFKYWTSRICETDSEARRALERNKMENMWMLAKAWSG